MVLYILLNKAKELFVFFRIADTIFYNVPANIFTCKLAVLILVI